MTNLIKDGRNGQKTYKMVKNDVNIDVYISRIKGLCEATEYDIDYTWNWLGYEGDERVMRYMGPMNSSISYHEGDGTWKIDKVCIILSSLIL